MQRALLLILFFFTGATALGYQLVWTRMLANILGHEMPAVIGVVTAFMGGMALGSWWLGKLIRRSGYPGRWYAGLEIFIGLCAMAVPASIPWLLFPALIAMGGTFPAMVRFMQGQGIAAFYATNTLGAVIGVVGTTWLLLPALGLRASAIVLGGLNIAAGLIAWWVTGPTGDCRLNTITLDRRSVATIGITGFLAIGFEVLGVRVLSQVMENTVYSFAAALAVYLLGTSLGATLCHRFRHERWLNHLFGATAIICLASAYVLSFAQPIYDALRSSFGDSIIGVAAAEMGLATCVFLGPTMCMGALFSLLMQRVPDAFPNMLAVNTLGSAIAPFACGAILLPSIGSKWALVTIAAAYLVLGSVTPVSRPARWNWLTPTIAIAMVAFLPQLRFVDVPPNGAIVDYREGMMASVAVVRDAAGDRTLKVNNRFQMGGTSAANTEYRQAHLPLSLHPQPQRALFLGTGTGITFGAAAEYPELQADGVELLPEVVEMMHHFKPQNFLDAYGNRLRMHVADARRFVIRPGPSYGVIVADLFHPARDGAGTLYTREHFAAIRARLTRSGLFCQWLPLHQMDEHMLRVVVRTFLDVFPNTRAYLLHWSVDVPVLALIYNWRPSSDQIANDPKISGGFVAGPDALRKFADNAPINTDDLQIVTYAAPRFSYQRNATPYGRLLAILDMEPPPNEFLKARNVYLHGLVHETEGRIDQAIDAYIESARISDDFTMGYSRCLSMAVARAKERPAAARALLQRLVDAKPNEKLASDLLRRLFPASKK